MHEDAKCTKEIRYFSLCFNSAWTVVNMYEFSYYLYLKVKNAKYH